MSANAPFYGLSPIEHKERKAEAYSAYSKEFNRIKNLYTNAGYSYSDARDKAIRGSADLRDYYTRGDFRTKQEKQADDAAAAAAKAASDAAAAAEAQQRQQQQQHQQMMQQQQEMMQQAKNMMEAMTAPQEEEAIQVDGISSGFAEPEPAEKEFQDQTAVEVDIDTIDDLHDLSMSALRPEIIAKFVGCYGHDSAAGEGIGSYKFKDLLEANILRDQLTDDVYRRVYDHLSEAHPDILDKASERADEVFKVLQEEVNSLVSYRNMIDEALSSLDLQECGVEIGEIISEISASFLQDEDTLIEKLPVVLEDLVAQSLNIRRSVDQYFSNSKLYFGVLASLYEAMTGYSSHMTSKQTTGGPFHMKLRSRAKYTSNLFKSRQKVQTSSVSKSVIKKGVKAIVPGFQSNKATSELQQLICLLSNEMIVSGGIMRLVGTELGNKYGVTTENPFSGVFGIDMGLLYGAHHVDIPAVAAKKGSLADFITIEDTDSNRVVLPFELNDVVVGNKKYLAGSKYVVEGPSRKIDESFANPLGKFVRNFDGELKSASAYFNELMGLDESTLLAPQGLLIRILEDVRMICLEASKPIEQVDRNVIKSAAKITMCNQTKTHDPGGHVAHIPRHIMNSAELLNLLEIVSSEEEQPEHRAAIHQEILGEIDKSINNIFRSRNNFQHTITERWMLLVNSKNAIGAQDVIPIGTFSDAKFQVNSEGEIESVHKMIMTTVDEIMAESHAFAGRKGSDASYKNSEGLTALSGLDYSAILSIVYYLYHWLINDLYHWKGIKAAYSSSFSKTIQLDRQKNKIVADSLTSILSTYKEAGEFEDLFDEDQNSLSVEGITSNTRIGKSLTMGKIIDMIEGLKRHRSFFKCNVSALTAMSRNIAQKSDSLTAFQTESREVLTGKVKLANVKNKQIASFCGLIKQPVGKEALRGLTSMQVSNTVSAMNRMMPVQELEKRQARFVMTPGLVEALRIFNDSTDIKTTEGIVCVGLPNGMIDNLRMSVVSTTTRKNESSDLGKLKIRFTRDNEFYTSLGFRDVEFPFDSSLYLMPDSYDGVLTEEEQEDTESKNKNPDPLRDMINKTIFYRMESGVVVEKVSGQEIINNSNENFYTILKNHVFSDLSRISIDTAMGIDINEADLKKYEDLNSSHISSHGLNLVNELTKKKGLNLLNTTFSSVKNATTEVEIDEITTFYEMKTGFAGQVALRRMSDYDVCDIKRAGQSCLYTAELDRHRILGTSMFDRVFYVPVRSRDFRIDYSEGLIQERRRFRYGRLSGRRFDLSGYVCDVRVS